MVDPTNLNNIKLTIAYDGTAYLGWQKTAMGPSIEESLQAALEQILQHPIKLQAASRTDAGVHAEGQVVNFFTSKLIEDFKRLQIGINSLLPKDIVVLEAEKAPAAFHPTLDCIGKEYHYYVCYGTAQLPHHRLYSWHYPCLQLDLDEMRKSIPQLVGEHDFSSFTNVKNNETYDNHIRRVDSIEMVIIDQNRLRFDIRGNHFLYKMVRNLVGTLVYIGCGKLKREDISDILLSHDRTKAGMTALAHGLFLYKMFY